MKRSRSVWTAILWSAGLGLQAESPENPSFLDDRLPRAESISFDPDAARAAYERSYTRIADSRSQSEWAPIVLTPQDKDDRHFWAMESHQSITGLAATYWGLPSQRVETMRKAADQPDPNQWKLEHLYNQQWSHAFLMASNNVWKWGDADDDFHDNLDGDGGEIEGHEGWQEWSALEAYRSGNQPLGDWYVGYATHYIADVTQVGHCSWPTASRLDLLTKHFAFEEWIQNNMTQGHRLLQAAAADPYYFVVTSPKASIRNAAYFSSYNTGGVGKRVWDAYVASGYPTAAGTGRASLVEASKEMLIRAMRYVRGTIKYALDKNGQW